ncbi:AAA domain (Cdc48 subfamily)/ATPase family associated with various cellular activities (AAA)/AAA+ lid domain/Peptidase family M41, putative [Angomonas deanei]|uniref:AAA domain (Cdc48 subfamily)/ATPase family associated with various cellular activities (AAA)/AAA+ lid domain/Peptidase family M41, putative n=1 Tax=Angomonas deanei TaxID=59799 RepID=A0A7G2C2V3_9TRYP|nr:AAA domain (Cdc48 subfamily)/ATPase family associated with various cellular activities (AAA)/AAA+ lid domain/Peptidase family M41, putative [Angomonas deanei]
MGGILRHPVDPTAWIQYTQIRRSDLLLLYQYLQEKSVFGKLFSKNNDNNNNDKGKDKKKKDDNDNDGNQGESEEDEDPTYKILPPTCMFVLLMYIMSFLLYWMERPSGGHTGWASLYEHVGDIVAIDLYSNYAQVYLLNGKKMYVGLAHDKHTQAKLDHLSDAYAAEVQKQKKADADLLAAFEKKKEKAKSEEEVGEPPHVKDRSKQPDTLQINFRGTPIAETALSAMGVFAWVVPFIFFPVFVMFLSQFIGSSMSNAVTAAKGKSKVKDMAFKLEKNCNTRFRDIAGMKEPKGEITEIVDFLRHPERYTRLGAKIPTGALLLGPPGTGKTLLAKAVAGESDVGFIPVTGSDFVELYVGMGALRVRQLFAEAKKQRCIVYIDEIDAIGLKRQGAGQGEKQEQEQTLNELLTQLDGFNTGKRGDVMVLASSNVAQEALDPALIRPGRFDRIIHVDSPVLTERIDIFKVHLSKLKLTDKVEEKETPTEATDKSVEETEEKPAENKEEKMQPPVEVNTTETRVVVSSIEEERTKDESLREEESKGQSSFDFRSLLLHKTDEERVLIDSYAKRMSNLCPGFVGADIANVCNEAAILAARENATHVNIHHLERSIDRVIAGIEHRSRVMSDFEKNVVAHHEAGHAVAGWFLNRADPLMKVSIVPRGGSALGYAQYLPNENYTRTAQEMRDSIKVTLGGRVAEKIFFNHLSTGASDDLRKVGKAAYGYVASFGKGAVYPAPGTSETRYVKPYGAHRSNEYDKEAKELVDGLFQETYDLLLAHKEDMEKLAKHLLKHELLTYHDVVMYLGNREERASDKRKGV